MLNVTFSRYSTDLQTILNSSNFAQGINIYNSYGINNFIMKLLKVQWL
jgi:hypothetical protein